MHDRGGGGYWAEALDLPAGGLVAAEGATFSDLTEQFVVRLKEYSVPEPPADGETHEFLRCERGATSPTDPRDARPLTPCRDPLDRRANGVRACREDRGRRPGEILRCRRRGFPWAERPPLRARPDRVLPDGRPRSRRVVVLPSGVAAGESSRAVEGARRSPRPDPPGRRRPYSRASMAVGLRPDSEDHRALRGSERTGEAGNRARREARDPGDSRAAPPGDSPTHAALRRAKTPGLRLGRPKEGGPEERRRPSRKGRSVSRAGARSGGGAVRPPDRAPATRRWTLRVGVGATCSCHRGKRSQDFVLCPRRQRPLRAGHHAVA